MPDVFTVEKRSDVMSRIRSSGNKDTELKLMLIFRLLKISGWRRHQVIKVKSKTKDLKVKPDFVFRKLKMAVFVDGCFWHACPKCYNRPMQNRSFWDAKRETNAARDRKVNRMLKAGGWRVLRIWEHELTKKSEGKFLRRLKRYFDYSETL